MTDGFRKSSRCGSSACVEVDLTHAYHKSSYCEAGNCVEVDLTHAHTYVAVRDSEDPDQELLFTPDEWAAFVAGVKNGEFDIPEED